MFVGIYVFHIKMMYTNQSVLFSDFLGVDNFYEILPDRIPYVIQKV